MKNKWASCSSHGVLSFNDELLSMEKKLGEYAMVHELLHLNVPNHGKLWKSLMTAYLGPVRKVGSKIKKQITDLLFPSRAILVERYKLKNRYYH
jgi:predicted metal-dependent hydrolase